MRISIALATYNGAAFLGEQLDSLARQTHLPAELVVCDDGSTDATRVIVRAFSAKAPFTVQLVENERKLGWKDNFLKAARLCTGDWIAFCDQDDVWMAHKLARVRDTVERNPGALLVVHAATVTFEDLRPTRWRLPDIRRFRIAGSLQNRPWNPPSGFACCFKRTLLEGVPVDKRPHDPNWPDDLLSHGKLVYLLANVWGEIVYLPDVLVLYRRHDHAVTIGDAPHRDPQGWRRHLENRLRVGSDEYLLLSRVAYESSDFLTELAGTRPDRESSSLRGAAYYRTLADELAARADLYSASGISTRVRCFWSLFRSGAYSPALEPRLGLRAMGKDAALVTLSPVLEALRRARAGTLS